MLSSKTSLVSTDKFSLSNNMSAPTQQKPIAQRDKWTNTLPIWSLSSSQNWLTQAWVSRKHWKSGQRYGLGKNECEIDHVSQHNGNGLVARKKQEAYCEHALSSSMQIECPGDKEEAGSLAAIKPGPNRSTRTRTYTRTCTRTRSFS